jgi:hypothetical protein
MKSLTRAINNIRNPDEIKNKAIRLLTGYKESDTGTCNDNTKPIEMKEGKKAQ